MPYNSSGRKHEAKIAGVAYSVAVDDDNRLIFISTDDPRFQTPEGLSVDSTLEQVLATGARQPIAEKGWAFHTRLPSGWSAAFVSGPGKTDLEPRPTSKVAWFFKRNLPPPT